MDQPPFAVLEAEHLGGAQHHGDRFVLALDVHGGDLPAGPVAQGSARAGAEHLEVTATARTRSEEHTSELQSRELISYAVFCLKKKKKKR